MLHRNLQIVRGQSQTLTESSVFKQIFRKDQAAHKDLVTYLMGTAERGWTAGCSLISMPRTDINSSSTLIVVLSTLIVVLH